LEHKGASLKVLINYPITNNKEHNYMNNLSLSKWGGQCLILIAGGIVL